METIRNLDVKGKKVLLRVDFNVPIKNGVILDDNRIISSLETINYLLEGGAKLIILSHFGRITSEEDKGIYSLNIVAKHLSKYVKTDVVFVPETRGKLVKDAINDMNNGTIIMIENTRFEDYPRKLESSCDEALSKYWASLGDIFVFDAFGSAHRRHASTYGISKYIPSYAGFLVEKEVNTLSKLFTVNKTFVLGGSKIEDKIPLIKNLIRSTDHILLGGGICFTFLKAKGYNVGKSIVSEENLTLANELLNRYKNKFELPVDIVTDKGTFLVNDIPDDATGYDIGPKTIKNYADILINSKNILWNGPLGKYEEIEYEEGTKKLLEVLYNSKGRTILVGGDIVSASKKYNFDYYYVSTGGGSTLEFLSGKKFKTLSRLNGENINN